MRKKRIDDAVYLNENEVTIFVLFGNGFGEQLIDFLVGFPTIAGEMCTEIAIVVEEWPENTLAKN